jgi:hypothetical protein
MVIMSVMGKQRMEGQGLDVKPGIYDMRGNIIVLGAVRLPLPKGLL